MSGERIPVAEPLPLFGWQTGRHAMRNRDANAVVRRLNALCSMQVVKGVRNELLIGDSRSVLSLRLGDGGAGGAATGLQVVEVQAEPSEDALVVSVKSVTFVDGSPVVSGDAFNVGKPYELRSRPLDNPATWPVYAEGDLLIVAELDTGIEDVAHVDLNVDGRRWSRVVRWRDYEDGCSEWQAKFHCSEPEEVP